MRLSPLRLLAFVLPLAVLAGCGSLSPRSCGGDTDYLQAGERAPLRLPPEVTPTERIQPMQIPAADPDPQKLDPLPRCLDEPPQFAARRPAAATQGAATSAPIAAAPKSEDPAEEAVRLWAWAWASRKSDVVLQIYSPSFQAPGEGGAQAFFKQRQQQVETGLAPEPGLEQLTVTSAGSDQRVVTFVQRFGTGAMRKEITLQLEGVLWRIVAERTIEIL